MGPLATNPSRFDISQTWSLQASKATMWRSHSRYGEGLREVAPPTFRGVVAITNCTYKHRDGMYGGNRQKPRKLLLVGACHRFTVVQSIFCRLSISPPTSRRSASGRRKISGSVLSAPSIFNRSSPSWSARRILPGKQQTQLCQQEQGGMPQSTWLTNTFAARYKSLLQDFLYSAMAARSC